MRNTFGKIQSVSNQVKIQLNLSTMATLGAEESGCYKMVNVVDRFKSQCMDYLSAGTKKVAVLERWPVLVEAQR